MMILFLEKLITHAMAMRERKTLCLTCQGGPLNRAFCRNIFGLVTLDSRLQTYMDRPDEFPSTRIDKLPVEPAPEYTQRRN